MLIFQSRYGFTALGVLPEPPSLPKNASRTLTSKTHLFADLNSVLSYMNKEKSVHVLCEFE